MNKFIRIFGLETHILTKNIFFLSKFWMFFPLCETFSVSQSTPTFINAATRTTLQPITFNQSRGRWTLNAPDLTQRVVGIYLMTVSISETIVAKMLIQASFSRLSWRLGVMRRRVHVMALFSIEVIRFAVILVWMDGRFQRKNVLKLLRSCRMLRWQWGETKLPSFTDFNDFTDFTGFAGFTFSDSLRFIFSLN